MKLPLTGMLHADPCMGLWEFRAQGQSWFLADQWPNISKLKSCLMGLAIGSFELKVKAGFWRISGPILAN